MAPRLKPLREQTIVITGGSSGNGLATAREAVARGAAVVLAARNGEALERIREELAGLGGRVAVCAADVAIEADVERIAAAAIEHFGGFDSWVNCAAAATYGTVEQVTIEDQRRVFDVNYFGLLKGSLIAVRHLRERGGGAIINIGSVLSDRAMIFQGPYSASKHAVQAVTDALRMELERDRAPVSVTLIKPGSIATPYPEHARNYMDAPPRLPPMLYDPVLVADAVLHACEVPRRQLYVGGSGYLVSLMGRAAPRLTDFAMEAFGASAQQKPGDAGDPAKRDNLYEARSDGEVHGGQDVQIRRTSLLLEAQKSPFRLPFAVAAAGLELIGAVAERAGALRADTVTPDQEKKMSRFADRFIEALRHLEESGETSAIVDLFADGAEISNPLVKHEAGGREAAERFWTSYRAAFSAIRSEFRQVADAGGTAFLEWVSSGTAANGTSFRYGGVSVIEHDGQRIGSFRTYFDTAQIPR
ncbi:SDR family oxidoreductase [Sphingosinicella sp. BN140058]|uniref:SDR family oxidoreductase n=1 Tax=Sphingosinicella sp. BN140058 TaxID=1892855 RepID=UPI001012B7CE|nr:SDR family oxidoreductase [Sphingosinicella sp. BN140058]QAY77827.1 SDR family NAD(P)-dependent oxidoreductase [Sphingosinicella sp. BN140058]